MAAMFKRFEGSGLLKLIASAGIVAKISVNKALKGQHFRRIVRASQLVCKALQLGITMNEVRVGIKLSRRRLYKSEVIDICIQMAK